MQKSLRPLAITAALALAGVSLTPLALADKPEWTGKGKPDPQTERHGADSRYDRDRDQRQYERNDRHDSQQRRAMVELRFSDGDRRFIRDYYGAQMRAGQCPPGLAKKNNGCLPPGQARQWHVGQPLPTDLRRYPLPPDVLIRLPMPPAGHEFVRVASDILLIAVGTGMVIDAVQDLGR